MLRCALSVLMGKRRVRIADVARATGISRNQLTRMYNDQALRVELGDIEKLCHYFGCDLHELFELIPDPESEKSAPEGGRIVSATGHRRGKP